MKLDLPLALEHGVELVSQSEDGVFEITYHTPEGNKAVVFWPDRFKRYKEANPQEGHAIRVVQAFMIERLCGDV